METSEKILDKLIKDMESRFCEAKVNKAGPFGFRHGPRLLTFNGESFIPRYESIERIEEFLKHYDDYMEMLETQIERRAVEEEERKQKISDLLKKYKRV